MHIWNENWKLSEPSSMIVFACQLLGKTNSLRMRFGISLLTKAFLYPGLYQRRDLIAILF